MARTYRHFNFAGPGILLTLLMVISNTAFAQNEVSYRRGATQLEDILPPSPEAASKVKYADVPFTHSMGAAEYSVPIYELKGHRLTIPVSLDYCSNGIKLDEIAGVAGLGWTLNAGGCITREVVYMPDEFEDGTFSYRWPDSSVLQSLLARTTDNASASFLTGVAWNRMDTNSDRYSYSVMGLKGQFILDPDGKVVQIQGDGVEISYSTETVGGREEKAFTVTGPDGTVYTFGCREAATRKDQYREPTYSTGQQVDWSATTAWHLTQVTSRDGTESASFSYADGGTWDRSTATVSKTVTETPSRNTSGHDESYGSEYTTVRSSHQTKVLTGITLSGYTASFSYESVASRSLHSVTSGSDAANYPRRLTRVRVTDAAGRQLLRAETDTRRDSYDGRIVLAGVTFYGSDDVTVEDRWTFAYHTAKGAVSRYSQDWYGYFNGENGDGTMLHPIDEDASRTDLCPYLLNSSPNYTMSLAYGAPKPAEASYMMLTSADHDGARTEWEYGGALTGAQITVAGKTVPVSVGVRVESIRVLDGAALKRVRTFSYGSPTTSAPALPLKEVYLRTSARLVLDNLTLPSARTAWTFTLSETPVTDGQALTSARVWYGSVTEDVSADGNSVGNRTVYTYDTAPVYNPVYDAGARFPSTWRETYSEGRLGIAPLSGVEQEYTYDGASTAPRLVRRETYRRNPSTGTAELVEKEETSYTSFPSASQLTGYRAVRVMQRLEEGPVYDQDFQHYPVYSQRSMGSAPSSVTRIGYHHSGNDTTVVSYGVVRNSYDKPARRSAASSGPYSSAGLLETRYSYTLQQWTESVNTTLGGRPLFSETLGYDTTSASLGGPSYAGLITRKTETWSVPTGPTQSRTVSRTEDYAYDYAARLSAWDDSSKGEDISYDARGNMTSVEPRHGSGGAAAMTYSGDRLATRKVGSGATLSFAHDSFARMTEDGEAGLSVTYNVFDLPENISRGDTVKVRYAYLSDGTKVSALDASGAGLVYRGPFTYRRSPDGSSAFESAPFDGGWLTEAGVRICVTDHLGDVRAVIDGGSSVASYPPAGFFSMDDFAPFGTKSASAASEYLALKPTGATVSLRYGFTGKEDQEPDFGLPYTDFGARHYSPSLGRWLVPDPLGERHFDVSPYVYCFNNPTLFIDPDGRDGYEGSNGLYRWFDDRTGNNPFVDDDGTEWKWITDDRKAWNEAIVIREANIDALIMLNFNEKQVRTDVRLFPGTSALFTKESKLLNHEKYTEKWGRRFNSENFRRDAKESDDLGESGFRLKYYPETLLSGEILP